MARSQAFDRGSGACFSEKKLKNRAIWCDLENILLKNFFVKTAETLNFTRKTNCFYSQNNVLKYSNIFVSRVKRLTLRVNVSFTCKTFDFTRKTVIYDTNGLQYIEVPSAMIARQLPSVW